MSDWDFLHEMRDEGYSPEDIADAAASGASHREWEYIAKQETKMELEDLNCSETRGEFLPTSSKNENRNY